MEIDEHGWPSKCELPPLAAQAERLIDLGVPGLLGTSSDALRTQAAELSRTVECASVIQKTEGFVNALLVPTSAVCGHAALMELIEREGKRGFVVEDFTDSIDFASSGTDLIHAEDMATGELWYALVDPQRGDSFQNASPAEALQVLQQTGRSPLTILEGIFWLLQQPSQLEPGSCFMTIGSRKRKAGGGFDARTPALWISNGTGRDGTESKNAAKLGWCWWNNRHTWLGIANAAARVEASSKS